MGRDLATRVGGSHDSRGRGLGRVAPGGRPRIQGTPWGVRHRIQAHSPGLRSGDSLAQVNYVPRGGKPRGHGGRAHLLKSLRRLRENDDPT